MIVNLEKKELWLVNGSQGVCQCQSYSWTEIGSTTVGSEGDCVSMCCGYVSGRQYRFTPNTHRAEDGEIPWSDCPITKKVVTGVAGGGLLVVLGAATGCSIS